MNEVFMKQIKLLYVEDDSGIRNILSKRLQRVVKELVVAEDGQEGYEKFCEYKPDLILTDITMPRLTGIEMAKKIREENQEIPIIVLSAHADSSFLLEAIESGISGYLLKPIDKEKLFTLLESNAKNICLEKITKLQQQQLQEQKLILQNIIDAEKNISFVTDFKKISFANKAFLDFFNFEEINEFEKRFESIIDIFAQHQDFVHKGVISQSENIGIDFYNKVNELDETKRVCIMLDKKIETKSFFINISIINQEKNLFLINLTDITKMTIEKINTEHKAYYDGLTGVYNRNKFEEIFNNELLRVQRYKNPLSIAILDIDHFKNFNDTHGHLIGDEVLILIAKEIQNKIRTTDVFARWGGEEFIILFKETELEHAHNKAEHLRQTVEALEHNVAGKITVSFGITEYKEDDTLDSLFKRCDDALYKAKQNGRNRVEISD